MSLKVSGAPSQRQAQHWQGRREAEPVPRSARGPRLAGFEIGQESQQPSLELLLGPLAPSAVIAR